MIKISHQTYLTLLFATRTPLHPNQTSFHTPHAIAYFVNSETVLQRHTLMTRHCLSREGGTRGWWEFTLCYFPKPWKMFVIPVLRNPASWAFHLETNKTISQQPMTLLSFHNPYYYTTLESKEFPQYL